MTPDLTIVGKSAVLNKTPKQAEATEKPLKKRDAKALAKKEVAEKKIDAKIAAAAPVKKSELVPAAKITSKPVADVAKRSEFKSPTKKASVSKSPVKTVTKQVKAAKVVEKKTKVIIKKKASIKKPAKTAVKPKTLTKKPKVEPKKAVAKKVLVAKKAAKTESKPVKPLVGSKRLADKKTAKVGGEKRQKK